MGPWYLRRNQLFSEVGGEGGGNISSKPCTNVRSASRKKLSNTQNIFLKIFQISNLSNIFKKHCFVTDKLKDNQTNTSFPKPKREQTLPDSGEIGNREPYRIGYRGHPVPIWVTVEIFNFYTSFYFYTTFFTLPPSPSVRGSDWSC